MVSFGRCRLDKGRGMYETETAQSVVTTDRAGLELKTVESVAVRVARLTKHFGSGEQRVEALRGVDWDVYAGQMTLLVGPSGCGKTTLLSIIAGILDSDGDGGTVSVLGHDMTTMNDRARTQFRV